MVFSILTRLWDHRNYLIPKHVHHPPKKCTHSALTSVLSKYCSVFCLYGVFWVSMKVDSYNTWPFVPDFFYFTWCSQRRSGCQRFISFHGWMICPVASLPCIPGRHWVVSPSQLLWTLASEAPCGRVLISLCCNPRHGIAGSGCNSTFRKHRNSSPRQRLYQFIFPPSSTVWRFLHTFLSVFHFFLGLLAICMSS